MTKNFHTLIAAKILADFGLKASLIVTLQSASDGDVLLFCFYSLTVIVVVAAAVVVTILFLFTLSFFFFSSFFFCWGGGGGGRRRYENCL